MPDVTIVLKKDSADSKVGVRLVDDRKRKTVKVMDVDPEGPLAPVISKGDTIVSINGIACNQGHDQAAQILRTTQGSIELIVRPPAQPSGPMRFFRKSSGGKTPRSMPDLEDNGGAEDTPGEPTGEYEDASAVVALQSWARGRAVRKSLEESGATASATGDEDEPEPVPQAPRAPGEEYTVTLKRNNSPSIGMRLVQKRYDELPSIADIDKDGPAAGHNIAVGDILLEVNGVDARASHEELKVALGSTQSATLRLRRPDTASLAPTPAPKPSEPSTKGGGGGGGGGFFPCCMHRAG